AVAGARVRFANDGTNDSVHPGPNVIARLGPSSRPRGEMHEDDGMTAPVPCRSSDEVCIALFICLLHRRFVQLGILAPGFHAGARTSSASLTRPVGSRLF
ncbi:hypothetical protein RB213_004166, partial [Colletotrichum asianum]